MGIRGMVFVLVPLFNVKFCFLSLFGTVLFTFWLLQILSFE